MASIKQESASVVNFEKYPEIGLQWKEPGISFEVVFFKRNVDYKSSPQSEGKTVEETVEVILSFTPE
ncbi:MAG: hypothetical protein M0Q51_07235 [Bacteroidales bacterium]|nr:hypothetical protein [Bacteroidales bacterium]